MPKKELTNYRCTEVRSGHATRATRFFLPEPVKSNLKLDVFVLILFFTVRTQLQNSLLFFLINNFYFLEISMKFMFVVNGAL